MCCAQSIKYIRIQEQCLDKFGTEDPPQKGLINKATDDQTQEKISREQFLDLILDCAKCPISAQIKKKQNSYVSLRHVKHWSRGITIAENAA